MNEKHKFWIRFFFLIWAFIVFFFYYRTELIHNLDHIPISLQGFIKNILFIK